MIQIKSNQIFLFNLKVQIKSNPQINFTTFETPLVRNKSCIKMAFSILIQHMLIFLTFYSDSTRYTHFYYQYKFSRENIFHHFLNRSGFQTIVLVNLLIYHHICCIILFSVVHLIWFPFISVRFFSIKYPIAIIIYMYLNNLKEND